VMWMKSLLLVAIVVGAGYQTHTLFPRIVLSHPIPESLIEEVSYVSAAMLASGNVTLSRSDGHADILQNPTIRFSVWDENAIVYVTAGGDAEPGAAGVDDDGNAVVDDRGEMGATGTDDRVLTPGDVGYEDAEAGLVMATVLSRGAMRKVVGDAVIRGPGQVRIDVIDDQNRLRSRIVDLVSSSEASERR